MDTYIRAARMKEAGGNPSARGGWRVTAKAPSEPYRPMLKDTYPRNEYTMMPAQNAPKYYTGHFLKYDYKDAPEPLNDYNEGRPVVFKKQDIEYVQTKKKYGQNLKGQSSVPLHLCNDPKSLLYQRSLQPVTRNQTTSDVTSASSGIYTPFALYKQTNKKANNPTEDPLQTWINTRYLTTDGHRNDTDTSDRYSSPRSEGHSPEMVEPRRKVIRDIPEWYSESFPREKVANALKFMGEAKLPTQSSPRKQEFDVNFNGVI